MSAPSRRSIGVLVAALVIAAALGFAAPKGAAAAPDDSATRERATCGRPGQARCPMQAWMRTRLADPMSQAKLPAIAEALDRLAREPPAKTWVLWASSSRDGAAAARRGDSRAVRQSCRTCHDAYRSAYRKEHRMRPAPP